MDEEKILNDEALDAVAGGAVELCTPQTLTPEELAALLGGQQEEGQKKR